MVMPPEEFQRTRQMIQEASVPPAQKNWMNRKFFGDSRQVTADKQGRVLLPEDQCKAKKLKGEIVFVGTGSRFEIWSKASYEKASAHDAATYQQMAEAVGL